MTCDVNNIGLEIRLIKLLQHGLCLSLILSTGFELKKKLAGQHSFIFLIIISKSYPGHGPPGPAGSAVYVYKYTRLTQTTEKVGLLMDYYLNSRLILLINGERHSAPICYFKTKF